MWNKVIVRYTGSKGHDLGIKIRNWDYEINDEVSQSTYDLKLKWKGT